MVSAPVESGIPNWLYRDICHEVCPYNIKFAQALKVPEFAPREFPAGKDAATLARDVLALTQEEFSAAFKGSPMTRAKLRGLKRNAAVALGNAGTADDVETLERASMDEDALVREHAVWALARLTRARAEAPRRHGSRPGCA